MGRLGLRSPWNQPWYHDFSVLGRSTPQADGMFAGNQHAKETYMFPFIERAIAIAAPETSGLEMFCADGFYSHFALEHGASTMLGIDIGDEQSAGNPLHLRQAQAMSKALNHLDRAEFRRSDVTTIGGDFDFTICAGGLYHLADPLALLKHSRDITRAALVVQTVYSLAHTSPSYFESPGPGWTWGCRFSFDWLINALVQSGWKVLDTARNELDGNERLEDRGSAYALCVPA